jgi:hypothetical protein
MPAYVIRSSDNGGGNLKRVGNQPFAQGEVNHAKRQKPKKFTKAEKQALQILIRNKRKR